MVLNFVGGADGICEIMHVGDIYTNLGGKKRGKILCRIGMFFANCAAISVEILFF